MSNDIWSILKKMFILFDIFDRLFGNIKTPGEWLKETPVLDSLVWIACKW